MNPTIRHEQIACMNMIYRHFSLEYFLDSVARIGYQSVAFWGGPPHFFIDEAGYGDVRSLKRKFDEHGLSCTCFATPTLLAQNQFAIAGQIHIEDTYAYFANGVRVASDLGATLMVANTGFGLRTEPEADAWARSRDMLRRVAEFAKGHGVYLTMESLRPQETNLSYSLARTKRMYEEVGHPHLKLMIDTTAAYVAKETIWDWFAAFQGAILNTHFVDGDPFGHLSWGDGERRLDDMLRCLNEYGYGGPIGLELTAPKYLYDPARADEQSYRSLLRFVK